MKLLFHREGQMPQSLTMIQIHKVTPVPSVLVITLMSLMYLTSSNIIQLMNYVGFATWLAIGVAVFCVIFLRFKHPEWERPIKVLEEIQIFVLYLKLYYNFLHCRSIWCFPSSMLFSQP